MNVTFEPAYRQLRQTEKVFVDGYVNDLEDVAVSKNVPLTDALAMPVNVVDERSRDMLERPLVRAAIAERVRELNEALEITAYRVLKELKAISFGNMGDYGEIGEDGWFTPDLAKCTPEQLSAIQSIETEETFRPNGGSTRKLKFKLYDKLTGLDKYMRYMGLLDSDNPHYIEQQRRLSKTGDIGGLPDGISDEQAADRYARHING